MTERPIALRRILGIAGVLMISDGTLAAARPSTYGVLWPQAWQKAMRYFRDRPTLTRALGLGEAAAGLWIALRQQRAIV